MIGNSVPSCLSSIIFYQFCQVYAALAELPGYLPPIQQQSFPFFGLSQWLRTWLFPFLPREFWKLSPPSSEAFYYFFVSDHNGAVLDVFLFFSHHWSGDVVAILISCQATSPVPYDGHLLCSSDTLWQVATTNTQLIAYLSMTFTNSNPG